MTATTTILDQVQAQMTSAAEQLRALRRDQADAMRDEIGRQHYDDAKRELPKLEHNIDALYRPFLERDIPAIVAVMAAQQKALSWDAQQSLRSMAQLCDSVPRTVRDALSAFDRLAAPIWTDGHSIDVNARAAMIRRIRDGLRNRDGVLGALENYKARVESYLKQVWLAEGV